MGRHVSNYLTRPLTPAKKKIKKIKTTTKKPHQQHSNKLKKRYFTSEFCGIFFFKHILKSSKNIDQEWAKILSVLTCMQGKAFKYHSGVVSDKTFCT